MLLVPAYTYQGVSWPMNVRRKGKKVFTIGQLEAGIARPAVAAMSPAEFDVFLRRLFAMKTPKATPQQVNRPHARPRIIEVSAWNLFLTVSLFHGTLGRTVVVWTVAC